MAKCPACGVNLNDWHILTLGAKDSIKCSRCRAKLTPPAKVSGIKVFVSVGFLAGGLGCGMSVAFGHPLQWIAIVLVWFLLLALADVRYTQLEVKKNGEKPAAPEK